jgi:hypothetical protein
MSISIFFSASFNKLSRITYKKSLYLYENILTIFYFLCPFELTYFLAYEK